MSGAPDCPAGCTVAADFAFTVGPFDVVRCPTCGLYSLRGESDGHDLALDRTQFDAAFRALRLSNYHRILGDVSRHVRLAGARLLDVGSSSGWFLETAVEHGCCCFGIEPDGFFCAQARQSLPAAVQVREGYFPRDLPPEWLPFDIITFHDVFEHLDNPRAVLQACRERLSERGLVILSVPSANGFVYRLGVLLYRLGWKSPLVRMFQVKYPFPHLFYFTPGSLERLAAQTGFEVVASRRLDGFAVRGALHRARMDEPTSAIETAWQYATALGLVVFALVQKMLPADNVYVVLQPRHA